jgi:hypothetical protein
MAKRKANGGVLPRHLVNIAAGALGIVTVSAAVFGMTHKEDIAVCSDRLGNATLFPLQTAAGQPLSPNDLQSRLAGRDWGLLPLRLTSSCLKWRHPPRGRPPLPAAWGSHGSCRGWTKRLRPASATKCGCPPTSIWGRAARCRGSMAARLPMWRDKCNGRDNRKRKLCRTVLPPASAGAPMPSSMSA